jgi:hypothetical protein
MSNHPITPPPELVKQWIKECDNPEEPRWQEYEQDIATRAARWGADQQLEACCEQLKSIPSPLGIPFGEMASNALRNACRPEPPSLKEQALSELNLTADPNGAELSRTQVELIRKALESL